MKEPRLVRARIWLSLALLLLLGAALRLVNLSAPPLDFHSTRQMRNALVARAIYYDALPSASPQERQLARSFRRAVGQYEPPIMESIVGFTFLVSGGESFAVPRIYGTVFWLVAGLALFDLGRRLFSSAAVLLALAYYITLPFGVQASRSFQPDPLMTATFVVGVYFLFRWMEEPTWRWAMLGALFAGLAVLVKLVIVFLVAGAAIAVVLTVLGRRFWRSAQVWAMFVLMATPATGYYVLAHPGRSTEYFFSWTVQLIKLITSPHFYADWLGYLGSLLGLTILFLGIAGSCIAPRRFRSLVTGLWIGYVLYGLVLPFQMLTHSYYHLQLVPVVALGLMPIIQVVVDKVSDLEPVWRRALILLVVGFIGYESWAARSALVADDFRQSPALWSAIGSAIPENSDVIALTQDYGFDLMYWGWRKVDLWPLTTDLAALKNSSRDLAARFSGLTAGHRYFLVTAFGQLDSQPELRKILEAHKVAAQGPGFVLYDLQQSQ